MLKSCTVCIVDGQASLGKVVSPNPKLPNIEPYQRLVSSNMPSSQLFFPRFLQDGLKRQSLTWGLMQHRDSLQGHLWLGHTEPIGDMCLVEFILKIDGMHSVLSIATIANGSCLSMKQIRVSQKMVLLETLCSCGFWGPEISFWCVVILTLRLDAQGSKSTPYFLVTCILNMP